MTSTAKPELRQHLRLRRRAIAPAQAAAAARRAAEHLAAAPFWRPGLRSGLYLPNDGELDTAAIAREASAAGHTLFLPRLAGNSLELVPWRPDDPLPTNRFGIGEPTGESVPVATLDLLLMPCVGWTRGGARLGMGGGFYDRCLAGRRSGAGPLLLGLAYACQEIEENFAEPWDVTLDAVLCEEGLLAVAGDDPRLQGRGRGGD